MGLMIQEGVSQVFFFFFFFPPVEVEVEVG